MALQAAISRAQMMDWWHTNCDVNDVDDDNDGYDDDDHDYDDYDDDGGDDNPFGNQNWFTQNIYSAVQKR